jgi:3-deoxy-D-manno-octulosonic-acid transferase
VVFVGGSLARAGGHNLLEPAALGRPILTGPDNSNGAEIAQWLLACGACEIVADAAALGTHTAALLEDEAARARMGAAGRALVEANRGALERVLALIEPYLAAASS